MLISNTLPRVFIFSDKGQDIRLTDPDPNLSPEAVLNFYANTYPVLTTAKISGPEIKEDCVTYQLESVMGTKG